MTMTLPTHAIGVLILCGTLAACGNSENADAARDALAAFNAWSSRGSHPGYNSVAPKLDAATLASMRQTLVQVGRPIYSVTIPHTRYANMMTPYGQNRNVQTWASGTPETVSLKDGVLVATRGFGPDMMTSVAPDIGQVRAGGGFHRIYYYLDGNDQPQSLEFDCTYTAAGSENVNVVGLSYPTRRVNEECSNSATTIQNAYWFDGSGKLRQSDQFVSPQLGDMRLQRVID